MSDPLENFSPPVRLWFRQAFGEPTPPQAQGWLPIQRGEHTLILAPTGSGKTLAAFLWGIDRLYRQQAHRPAGGDRLNGVRLLYVSPLKALNNDIERNLRIPLEGIREAAAQLGSALPALRVAVRTGDTPSSARAAMVKHPPDILITTPESLFLILTSPRAREMFRATRTVIVDEIHTLCGNKRGAHLSLSLERLCHLASEPVQRIGLSATIRPLEQAARFLGGQAKPSEEPRLADPTMPLPFRPVTVVNAGYRKPLDLQVVTAVDDFRELPGETIWPQLIPQVLRDIMTHHTTLVFANNRRLAERTADRLNMQFTAERSEEIEPGSTTALAPGGVPRDRGMFAIGAEGPFRAHHGSMSKQARRKMEQELKDGRLPALVGTSSLELGIDIGAVDLVVQLQSPKSVTQGLQRIGRSGHLVGQTSSGRIYATFREDLVEAAAIVRGMLEGDVESIFTPQNPLDVLAQQIVAMVACETWSVSALYELVRQAFPYHQLSRESFDAVLEMLSGKYDRGARSPVRARLVWDRVNDQLAALPGSRLLAMLNAGTISDTGAFNVYLSDGKTKLGELDEEFVFETRVGDAFLLGSHTWRVREIADDRIIVQDAAGATPRMPFWNGDYPYRPYELGLRIGRFRRQVAERISGDPSPLHSQQVDRWLRDEYALDQNSARNLLAHVKHQLDALGVISSDTTIVIETFQDAIGEPRMVIHSPFGGRVNGAWALALTSALRERVGVDIETQTGDDGILFRFPRSSEPPTDILQNMSPAQARQRILRELPNSAVFGAHFRMNAARALLLPKARGRKRTPFWLQRLKARDLLAAVRQHTDFPIIAETYRDCLQDVFDLPHLEEILNKIQQGEIRLVPIETIVPSPVAAGLLFNFISVYMYEWDAPKAERQMQALALSREVMDDALGTGSAQVRDLLQPEAMTQVESRAQHNAPGYQARSAEELAQTIYELGDLTNEEIYTRSTGGELQANAWISQLAAQNRIVEMTIPTKRGPTTRWVSVESSSEYQALTRTADSIPDLTTDGRVTILRRMFGNSGLLTREAILERYLFPQDWLDETLARLVASREIVQLGGELCDRRNLEQIHRRSLALLRKEIQPVSVYTYADFLTRWHSLNAPRTGETGLRRTLEQLHGVRLSLQVWEQSVLPVRVADFVPDQIGRLCQSGELTWVAQKSRVQFIFRGEGAPFLQSLDESSLSAVARQVYEFLKAEGASFTTDIQASLNLARASVDGALSELVAAGWVTNDSLDVLRTPAEATTPRHVSASPFESELAARLAPRPLTATRYRDARRRVARRLRSEIPLSHREGRWSVVRRASVLGQALSDEESAERLVTVLLRRNGVLMRECLEREDIAPEWARLYPTLQRMEMRGDIRRGYFVEGLSGAQFALKDAVEQLRAPGGDALAVLNATDPANIFGSEVSDAPRFSRLPSTSLVLWHGHPVLIAEEGGERLTTSDAGIQIVERALQSLLGRPAAPRHLVVSKWNGAGVVGTAGESLLESLGFYRTPKGMER